jgi:L-iditol 2-dehydrogenase
MKAIEFNPAVLRYAIGRTVGHTVPGVLWSGLSCTRYVDVPERSLPDGDWVRIKTRYGGICGTDLSTIRLHASMSLTAFCSFPNILGHEGVGRISAPGKSVLDFQVGERVVVEPLLWCTPRGIAEPCEFCQRGEVSLCQHATDGKLSAGMSIGFCRDTGGSWSEGFVAHRSQLYRIPDGISDKNALMVEPFSTGLHAVLQNMPDDDETVVILGAGTVGLCVIAALKVLARHGFQAKAALALGASAAIMGGEADTFRQVAESVGARIKQPMMGKPVMVGGVGRVFECVGSESSIGSALAMSRAGGRVVLVGMPSTLRLDWTAVSIKELSINASWAYHHAEMLREKRQSTFQIALDLMSQGRVNLEHLITHVFRLEEYKRAFEILTRRGSHQVIKAAFEFD